MLWGSSVRILHLVLGPRLFSMLFFFFFSKNVMLLYFTFKSLIHFELFFVQSVSFMLRLIFKNCPWIPIHLFLIFFFSSVFLRLGNILWSLFKFTNTLFFSLQYSAKVIQWVFTLVILLFYLQKYLDILFSTDSPPCV